MRSETPADTFLQEAQELLEQLERALLDLEQQPANRDLVDSAFRALHTIKGSGAMFGFDDVATFVHEFETAFDRVREGQTPPSHGLVAVALAAKDHIHKLIFRPDSAGGGDDILSALRRIVAPDRSAAPAAPAAADRWRIRFKLPGDALVTGTNPLLLLDELRELGPCEVTVLTDAVPLLADLEPETLYLAWDIVLTTGSGRAAIEDVFMFLRDDMDLAIEPLPAARTAGAAAAEAGDDGCTDESDGADEPQAAVATASAEASDAPSQAKSGTSLRVPAERLDELMDRVGELVIAQSRLAQIAGSSTDANLKSIAEELERLSAGLRDTTMSIRMVPIGTLFGRFRRLVRDLSHDLGKEIDFVTSGEATELDKTVIERLADPLVHLIRNAIDHGMETPQVRIEAGKPGLGRVRLSAVHAGGEVAISIADDGAGLDAARIRAKAEEAGLLAPDARIADAELYQLIFHPGFSTAREVTALSGRGVGMDVVKRTIEGLRGSIDIATVPGAGTTVTLHLPLTLAIIDSMLVRVGDGRYSIPLSAVQECVELPLDAVASGSGRNFLNIRGTLVPFLRLGELFRTTAPPDPHQKVVIVSSGDLRVGLVVDQILGNSQTVIKSLSKLHSRLETFSGASILGDGTVALILDVAHLVGFGQAYEERLKAERLGRAA